MRDELVTGDKKELPDGWNFLTLEQIVPNQKYAIKRGPFGGSITKDMFVSSGFKVYEQKNAIQNNFEIGSYYIGQQKFEEMKPFEVKEDDIIISCSGTIGKIAIVPRNADKGIINQALLKISLDHNKMLPKYFKYLFDSDFMQKRILKNAMGSSIKNVASVKILKKITFPVPPIVEQKKIINRIEGQITQIEMMKREAQKQMESVEVLFDSIINAEIMTAKTNLPKNWYLLKIEEICDLKTGGTPSKNNQEYFGGNIKWIVSGDVNNEFIFDVDGRITELGSQNSNARMLPKDSVLMALNGQGKTRGTVAVLNAEATCNQSIIAFIPKNREQLDYMFLFYYLKGCYQKLRNLTGDNERSGLSMRVLRPFQIIVPPIDIQKKLVHVLKKQDDGIKEISKNIHEQKDCIGALLESVLNISFEQYQLPDET